MYESHAAAVSLTTSLFVIVKCKYTTESHTVYPDAFPLFPGKESTIPVYTTLSKVEVVYTVVSITP